MAADVNQTIMDSRRAAMSILENAKEKERRRNNREPMVPAGGGRSGNMAVDNFLRAGRRNEMRRSGPTDQERAAAAEAAGLADRIREMSDDEFGEALRNGTLTTEQVRKAAESDVQDFILDVWSETDAAEGQPDPTVDEVITDPAKYGAGPEDQRIFARYRRGSSTPIVTKQ